MAEAPAVSLFPSSLARFLFFSIIVFFLGIRSGSLCEGESLISESKVTSVSTLISVSVSASLSCSASVFTSRRVLPVV